MDATLLVIVVIRLRSDRIPIRKNHLRLRFDPNESSIFHRSTFRSKPHSINAFGLKKSKLWRHWIQRTSTEIYAFKVIGTHYVESPCNYYLHFGPNIKSITDINFAYHNFFLSNDCQALVTRKDIRELQLYRARDRQKTSGSNHIKLIIAYLAGIY